MATFYAAASDRRFIFQLPAIGWRISVSEVWLAALNPVLPPMQGGRAAGSGLGAEPRDWLTYKVRPMFAQRVLTVSEYVMFKWRLLVEEGRKARHTFSQPDPIIAATAAHHGLVIMTRDIGDYQRARAFLFNPWVDPRHQPAGSGRSWDVVLKTIDSARRRILKGSSG
jgi:predicted nucleic acid-binding protein